MDITGITIVRVDVDETKVGEVAIQALNIKREGEIFDCHFVEHSNILVVKYLPNPYNNIEDVVKSWGKVIDFETIGHISVSVSDLNENAKKDLDDIYGGGFNEFVVSFIE